MIPTGYAPPPTEVGFRTVVAAELIRLTGRLTFDVASRRATADMAMVFTAGPNPAGASPSPSPASPGAGAAGASPTPGGAVHAAFDLRQPLRASHLDGDPLPSGALSHADLGGGLGAEMRLVGPFDPGSEHTLSLQYELATPDVAHPLAVEWADGAARFDVWCSDLYPGRYLEQWLPVGLCQDQFSLVLDVDILGGREEHRVVANAETVRTADHGWSLTWPPSHTSLSSLLILAPVAELQAAMAVARTGSGAAGSVKDGDVTVQATSSAGSGGRRAAAGMGREGGLEEGETVEAAGIADRVAGWCEENARTIGPYIHGTRFVAHAWAHDRGMEYDGATSCSVAALEHEVFHSWFGRGVKPGSANDGWIDEAYTTWSTSSRADFPRLAAIDLPLDLPPVVLDPGDPWSRHTPIESYRMGYRLFGALASVAGAGRPGHESGAGAGGAPGGRGGMTGADGPASAGAARVQEAMAAYYQARAGGQMTTDSLEAHLSETLSVDVTPWWDRYVRGIA